MMEKSMFVCISMCGSRRTSLEHHAIAHMTDYQAEPQHRPVNQSHLRHSKVSTVPIIETYAPIIAN